MVGILTIATAMLGAIVMEDDGDASEKRCLWSRLN